MDLTFIGTLLQLLVLGGFLHEVQDLLDRHEPNVVIISADADLVIELRIGERPCLGTSSWVRHDVFFATSR